MAVEKEQQWVGPRVDEKEQQMADQKDSQWVAWKA